MATAEELLVHARLRDDLSRPLRGVEQQVERTARRVKSLGAMARTSAGGRGLGAINVAGKTLGTRMRSLGGQVRSLSSDLGRTLVSGARAGAVALGAMTAAVGIFGIKASSQFQTSRLAFEALLGSAEKGNAMFAALVEMNKKTPFELGDLAGSTQLLLRYGVGADQVLGIVKSLSDAAALTLNPAENLNRLGLAVGQVVSSGRLLGGEARQLAEAGINAYGFFAEKLGITVAEARKLGEAGELSADMFVEGLLRGDKALGIVAGGAEKLNKTLLGQFSNLKDRIAQTFDDTAGDLNRSLTAAMPAIGDAVAGALAVIGPPIFDLLGMLAGLATKALPVLAPLFAALVTGVGRLLDAAAPALALLEPVVDELVVAVGELVRELVPVMPELVHGFVLLVGLLPDFVRLLTLLVPLVTPLVEVLDALLGFGPTRMILLGVATAILAFGPISSIVSGVWTFVAAIYGLATAYRTLGAAQVGAGGPLGGIPGAGGLPGAAGKGAGLVKGLGVAAVGATGVLGLYGAQSSAMSKGGASVGDVLGGAASGAMVGGALGSVIPGVGTAIGAGVGGVVGGAGTFVSGLFGKKKKAQAAPSARAGGNVDASMTMAPGAVVIDARGLTEEQVARLIPSEMERYQRERTERGPGGARG